MCPPMLSDEFTSNLGYGSSVERERMQLSPIGHIESPYLTKFGVPRQPCLAPAVTSRIVLDDGQPRAIAEALVPGTSAIVLWAFSHNVSAAGRWSKTVRPPLLGGTRRVGVFATRSSFRPNALALSCVRVIGADDGALLVAGGDMVDGTPVFGVVPYDESRHFHPDALEGWRSDEEWPKMERVLIGREVAARIPPEMREELVQVLRQDPRPAYTRSGRERRVFWTVHGEHAIWFRVEDRVLVVLDACPLDTAALAQVRDTGRLPEGYDGSMRGGPLDGRRKR